MKLKHVLMVLGLLTGVWLVFFSDKDADSDVVAAVVKPAGAKDVAALRGASSVSGGTSKSTAKGDRVIAILALTARQSLISAGHVGLDGKKIAASSSAGSTIFGPQSWVPPPPPVDPKLKNLPPPTPVAPPLNFTYLGKKQEAGVWEVYLARGEKSYIVRSLDVIDGTYRVDAVTPDALVLTYLPLNQVQQLNING
jgi:hypothetical protein